MKRILTMATAAVLIGLLAAGASAQTSLPNQGDENLRHNYENVPGSDGNGGIVRNGEEYFQVGEAHGPEGPGHDANKILAEGALADQIFIDEDGDGFHDGLLPRMATAGAGDGTGAMNGSAERHSWGPGEARPEVPFGPIDEPRFGPGGGNSGGKPAAADSPAREREARR